MDFKKFYQEKVKAISFSNKHINIRKSVYRDYEDGEKVDIWTDPKNNAIKLTKKGAKGIKKTKYGGGVVYVGRNFKMQKGAYEYDEEEDCFILKTK